MTEEAFYGESLPRIQAARKQLLELIEKYPEEKRENGGIQAIMYCCSRIKTPESMIKKLQIHGLPQDCESALSHMHDTIGIRIICSFFDEVYRVAEWLKEQPEIAVLQVKDYIAYPKPNGYRSYHLIRDELKRCADEIASIDLSMQTIRDLLAEDF